jgi:DNA-binding transcriptional MerR regulator
MNETYTIGKLAKLAGMPVSTLRYYEKSGLLAALGRSDGNYRIYGKDSLKELRFIRAAQSAGFTLNDIHALIEIRDGRTTPCGDVKILIEQRLGDLQKKLDELHHAEDVLASFVAICDTSDAGEPCRVLDRLSDAGSRSE